MTKGKSLIGKTWKQAVKEEVVRTDTDAVEALKNWEKDVLKEADPNY